MTQRKVAVFGLDGITFDLLQPWLDEGRLPNLARLLAEGAGGRLRSTIPPVSASAWPSFATGTNPGQHSLIDFTYPAQDSYEIRVSNGLTVAVPAVWQIAGAAGKQVGVVSLPMTYPPRPMNGFMLCSFLTPSADSDYTWPPELKQELIDACGPFPLRMSEKGRGVDPAVFVRACKQLEIDRARNVQYLLRERPWDLFVYVMETTDNLQHEVWHLVDKSHPMHDPEMATRVLPDILDYYETVDRLLGEMVALVPEEALVIVLSDHGFGPFHKFFHINNWVADNGGEDVAPGMNGIYVLNAPTGEVPIGSSQRFKAIVVKNGRPLAGQRAEIRKGSTTLGGKNIAADGTVDINLIVNENGPYTYVVDGSGLPPVDMALTVVGATNLCTANPNAAGCQNGGSGGGTTTTPDTTAPRVTRFYPAKTSGLLRTKLLQLRMHSNERAYMRVTIKAKGGKTTGYWVDANKDRLVKIQLPKSVIAQLRKAQKQKSTRNRNIQLTLTYTATDPSGNATKPKTINFRLRP